MGRATDRVLRVNAIVAAFNRTLSPKECAGLAVQQAIDAMGAYAGAVIVGDDSAGYSVLAQAGYGARLDETTLVAPDERWPMVDAARTGAPVWMTSWAAYARRYPHLANEADARTAALAALPLALDGRVFGALSVSFETGRRFTTRTRAALNMLAQLCAQALDRARLKQAEDSLREAAADAAQERDAFLSLAAHELKTPLTALYGYAQILRSSAEQQAGLGEREQRAIQVVVAQAERLNLLVDTLLDVSRIEGGRLELQRAPLDVAAVVRRVVDDVQPMLLRHTLKLEADSTVLYVDGDAVRLIQAFQNLLFNAIKYSPNGGEIVVRVGREDRQARVDVTDQGIGIPTRALPQVFTRYFRAANVDSTRISGLGIGLFIVSEIVALHGGSVAVESKEGSGSTFRVLLPLKEG